MKAWLKTVFVRIGDLIVKTIAFKVLAAAIVTMVFLALARMFGELSPIFALGGLTLVTGMWALSISYRYAEKLQGFVKKPEDRG